MRFLQANSASLNIMKYDQAKYDHVIIFAPKAKGEFTTSSIIFIF